MSARQKFQDLLVKDPAELREIAHYSSRIDIESTNFLTLFLITTSSV